MNEFWKEAIEHKVVPLQEWLMQGSILNNHRETLKHRLNGLCDNTETGMETFSDHEMVYTLRGVVQGQEHSFTFYVRKALDHPDMPWHVRYLGNDSNKSEHIIVRSCIESAVSQNFDKFLEDMGFRLDYEYVAKGYMFRRGKMVVTISTVFPMTRRGDTQTIEQLSMSHLVELRVVTTQTEQVEQDMKMFADQLKPLLILDKSAAK